MGQGILATMARGCLLTTVLLGASAGSIHAQAFPTGSPDFLFEGPRLAITLRGGMFLHRADGDLYDFTTERLTVDRSDFRGLALGLDGSVWIGTRAEAVLSLDGSRVTIQSEYDPDYMGGFVEVVEGPGGSVLEIPIRQSTRLRQGPAISLGLRYFLRDRGDQLGRFIWIPSRWNAFVGAGAGFTGYRLVLDGDFVDEAAGDPESGYPIHTATFVSEGNTAFPYVAAGLEFAMTPRTAIVLESRYQWGDHDLGPDFASDFVNPLDLSGARLSAGLQIRF